MFQAEVLNAHQKRSKNNQEKSGTASKCTYKSSSNRRKVSIVDQLDGPSEKTWVSVLALIILSNDSIN
jgi:hypothetical protein